MTTKEQDATTPTTAQDEAQGWRPEPGDVLTGTVTAIDKGWSDYTNSFYPIVTVRQEDGTLTSLHCFHEILKQRMLDLRPEIGTEITVTCGDRKQTRDGKRSFVTYTVTVPGDTGAATWNALGAQPHKAASAGAQQMQMGDDEDIPF